MTSVDRTAYPRFPRVVSGRELAEAFTPSDGEVDWARGRTQDAGHLLALVVWLKSYQRLGYFPKLAEVPGAVAGHVRGVLGLPDRVGLEQATERSAKRHRQFVRDRLEVVYEPARVRQVAEHAICRAVQAKDNPADLINVALEELLRARCELPGYTTLDAMTSAVRTEVNNGFYHRHQRLQPGRLGNHSRKNRLYRTFRELGRAIRTITLLRYLSEPQLREQITAITNRNEALHGFAGWLMFGGKLIGHNDPDYQEKVVKFNELIANCVIYSTACDITNAANQIAAEGEPVDLDDLAAVSPYITHTVRRFGNWIINLTPPDQAPSTRLDLEPRVLFPTGPA